MPCWFYDKKSLMNTPSIQDGIDHKTECQYRTEGAHLIVQVGSKLELGYNTLATGVVYFHRFYMFHSFKNFSPYITACCCLFLAGKAEETPKKSKEIIKIAKKFLSKERLLLLGKHPREEVMTMEKILLQTIKFDLKVQHPYKFLLKYPKYLKGDQRKKQRMVQMAWTFINDSLCTTLSIQWEPEILAIAVMYLSSKLAKFKVLGWSHRKPSHKYWWEIFVEDLTIQIVEDICHQVLDIYVPLSRYYVKESPVKLEPKKESKISEASKSNSCNAVANAQVAARDLKVENGNSIVLTPPITPAKDPRLQIGCADCCCNINPSNTPVMNTSLISMPEHTKLIPSPSTPTDPPPMDQSLHENSQIVTKPNIGRDPRDVSKYSLSMAKFNPSAMSSPPEPMEIVRNPLFDRGFSNMDKWQSKETEGLENSYNDDNQHGWGRNIGFGSANNNHSDDRSGGGPMRNRNFRNRDTNNYRDYRQNHRRRQGYENDNVNSDDHNENRPMRNRGFGNASSYDNRSHSENRFTGNRGFGNNNNNNSTDDDFKPFGNRGFGNSTNNSMDDDCKPFVKRGFGNNNNNNDNMDNDIKPFGKRGIGNENCTNNGNPNENRFSGRRGFGNRNCDDDRNSNGNRFTGRRGFGNKNGNDDRSFNRFTENRGFGNGNHNDDRTPDDNKLTLNKGFGNSNNDDNKSDETKSFMNRGFGNSNSQNNNYNGNDSRPRMGFNRENRFQRSDDYPRRFNNNYENDRYSNNNDTNGDTSKYFERRDAPGKMVDKQRFYQPPSQSNNIKVEEEESWD